jgi:hypothetical protein
VTRLGTSNAVALMALALGLVTSPDLPPSEWHPAIVVVVAGLTALFVVALLDRRAPRRLVGVGAATFALAVAYDTVRGEQGSITLVPGEAVRAFDDEGPGGRGRGLRPLGEAIVVEAVEPDGTIVLGQPEAPRRVRVSPRRAASVAAYRLGAPRRVVTLADVAPDEAVVLTVHREPAALLAGLGLLVAAIGVAWSRW